MGATDFFHIFEHYNPKIGVKELHEEATRLYGNDRYSGEINSIDISNLRIHRPQIPLKTDKQAEDYVYARLETMNKYDIEIIDLGRVGYKIVKPTAIEHYGFQPLHPSVLNNRKLPAALVNERGSIVSTGTVAELKRFALKRVIQQKFEHDYYIVSKNTPKVYKITGVGKVVKTTTKKSDATQLVLPMHRYIVYGIAPT